MMETLMKKLMERFSSLMRNYAHENPAIATVTTRNQNIAARKGHSSTTIVHQLPKTRRLSTEVTNTMDHSISTLFTSTETDSEDSFEEVPAFSENWSSAIPNQFTLLPDFSYPSPPEIKHDTERDVLPGHVFERFFDDKVFEMLTRETNRYASQKSVKGWTFTYKEEMKALLGMIIAMGIIQLNNIELYWSTDPFFGQGNAVKNVMTSKKFKKLLESLHCNNNEASAKYGEPGYDKLHKVRPLIDQLNKKFQDEYKHSSCQSIDESMILFKGRSSMKQYMPKKPIKRGYKVWVRADPITGYASQFDIYTGRTSRSPGSVPEYSLGSKVVKLLCENIEVEEYESPLLVCFDNFFTSFELMQYLFDRKLYAVGTVRTNRKTLPEEFKSKQKLKRGEHKASIKQNVCAIAWQDNRTVNLLTTAHNPNEITKVKRTEKDGSKSYVSCPKAIIDYTSYMRGVDRFDQLRESYSVSRKSKKYWFRIFYFLVDAALVNSYILYSILKAPEGKTHKISHMDFQKQVARHLIRNFSSRKKKGSLISYYMNKQYLSTGKALGVPPETRFANVGCHLPKSSESYRRYRLCSTSNHDKRSKIVCSTCMVPLCSVPCFAKFHQK